MNSLVLYGRAIDEIVAAGGSDSQRHLFDRYTILTGESEREAFVAALIAKVLMLDKRLDRELRRQEKA